MSFELLGAAVVAFDAGALQLVALLGRVPLHGVHRQQEVSPLKQNSTVLKARHSFSSDTNTKLNHISPKVQHSFGIGKNGNNLFRRFETVSSFLDCITQQPVNFPDELNKYIKLRTA